MALEFVEELARKTNVIQQTDVLVVGSGPGGLAAALGAARTGVDVTLVERFGCMGGNITAVGVERFAWYRQEKTVEANGIGREFEERVHDMGAAVPESQSLSYEIDSEGFKQVADHLVAEAGIYPEFIDGYGILILPTTGRYFQVPYRTMLPKGVKNLLVAERATGGDRVSHAATRNMSCCAVTGQGAGIAAALSVKSGQDLSDVNIADIQKELGRQGVRFA
jgi:FAD dependent oxidoreductase